MFGAVQPQNLHLYEITLVIKWTILLVVAASPSPRTCIYRQHDWLTGYDAEERGFQLIDC